MCTPCTTAASSGASGSRVDNPLDFRGDNARDQRNDWTWSPPPLNIKQTLLGVPTCDAGLKCRNQSRVSTRRLIRVMDETGRIIPAKDFRARDRRVANWGGAKSTRWPSTWDLRALHTKTPPCGLSVNMSARSIGYPRMDAEFCANGWIAAASLHRGAP